MRSLFANWQTTAAGVIVIALGAAKTFLGIEVPGFSLDFVAALPVGLGLILAKDATASFADPRFTMPKPGAGAPPLPTHDKCVRTPFPGARDN
jgi:hypothetical protein